MSRRDEFCLQRRSFTFREEVQRHAFDATRKLIWCLVRASATYDSLLSTR